jgi:transcriptional regulator with XRE-family HTH domain
MGTCDERPARYSLLPADTIGPVDSSRSASETTSSGHIGRLLRHWRMTRRVAQLALAVQAEVSARHLSYIEGGRALPSREMILRLADVLQIPLRERNTLLLAAGYAPLYHETDINTPEMAEARRAVEYILAQQDPFPAIVLDRHWNVLMTNAATQRFLALFPECEQPQPANSLRLIFHPRGLRPFVLHWEEVASRMIQRLQREAAANPTDTRTGALLEELLSYPGVSSRWRTPDLDRPPTPLLSICYQRDAQAYRFFSTITTFGTAQDITLQELRIECFFPADEATRTAITRLKESGPT